MLGVEVLLDHLTGGVESLTHISNVRHVDVLVALSQSTLHVLDGSLLQDLVGNHLLLQNHRLLLELSFLLILNVGDGELLLISELIGLEFGLISVLDLLLFLDFSIHSEDIHVGISLHLGFLELVRGLS